MSEALPPDDDTGVGRVTQGGHGKMTGRSKWWVLIVAVIATAAFVIFAPKEHKIAPAERGTSAIAGAR